MAGCREVELMFFRMKNSLLRLNLGDYITDELIVYIAEMCRGLETLELNSRSLSDYAVSHVTKRAENLKCLDVSGLTEFTGMAFTDVNEENFVSKKLQLVKLNLTGHELTVVKDRIAQLVPAKYATTDTDHLHPMPCQVAFDDKKAKRYFANK
jgi:hypothetical protein